jgi:hypothetical protein
MATQIISGNRVFAQPGIDGGEFQAANPAANVLIVTRMKDVEAIVVSPAGSSGIAGVTTSIGVQRYNSATSSGGFIPSANLSAGTNYDWIAIGVGG